MSRFIRAYYLLTPAFFLVDALLHVNIRIAFLDQWPAGKIGYYAFASLLGVLAWRRPEWTAKIGLIESGANVALIIIAVMVWYFGVIEAAADEFAMPVAPSPQALVNLVLAATIAGASYVTQRAMRRAASRSYFDIPSGTS